MTTVITWLLVHPLGRLAIALAILVLAYGLRYLLNRIADRRDD